MKLERPKTAGKRQIESMASILKHSFPYQIIHLLFYGDIESITYFPSSHDRSISMGGALPFSPLAMTPAPL